MWETLRPILRPPVIKSYLLKNEPEMVLPLSGTMALAHYSMLDEAPYPVYAVTKKRMPELDISTGNRVLSGETPGCIVQELGYHIVFRDGKAIDPLTVVLSLTEEELDCNFLICG